MGTLRVLSLSLPAATVGADNPLPPLAPSTDVHARLSPEDAIPDEDRRHMGWGMAPSPLPYLIQDCYDRQLENRSFLAVTLENEYLRATFLPELGGRLWSLQAKDDGREILYVNRAFQPANLAIRNAWFAGGVEWNIGLVGHSPFTCSCIFSATARGPGGMPMLRLWEWERIRCVPFQIDVLLPPGSRALLVHVTIANPNDRTVPMYWWSNAALRETPGMRVLAPAERAYTFAYGGVVRAVDVPFTGDRDVTRPEASTGAVDYFFRIPDRERRWIAALHRDGRGLAQTSTPMLLGRKLFLWGTSPGGRRWQEFLCGPGEGYLEIQAGLARTQAEHLPMSAGARWSWLEAYGPIAVDAEHAHGPDWQRACGAVAHAVEEMADEHDLARMQEELAPFVDAPPQRMITCGSGWGALERERRGADVPNLLPGIAFPERTLGPHQRPWLELLWQGSFPDETGDEPPTSCMAQPEWHSLLERSLREGRSRNWAAWNQAGILRAAAGEHEAALQALRESLAIRRTPWALRNLAVLVGFGGDAAGAAELLREAWRRQPATPPLALEAGAALLAAARFGEVLDLIGHLPPQVRARGRVLLLEARAALALGDLDRVQAVLDSLPVIPDMREGEVSLTDLWFALQERRLAGRLNLPLDERLRERVRRECPPPSVLDFRVSPDR